MIPGAPAHGAPDPSGSDPTGSDSAGPDPTGPDPTASNRGPIAGGIDLGGTKIEAQRFGPDWTVLDRRRVETPKSYPALVEATRDQVRWLRQGGQIPVGLAAAGLLGADGRAVAANLPSHGHPFPADLGAPVLWLNDCRAFTQAEAAASPRGGTLLGLVLGTGIGGAVAVDGRLLNAGAGQSGEFGHLPLSAALAARYGLPLLRCGCGRMGCVETYGAGPGLARLAGHLTGRALAPEEIAAQRGRAPELQAVWEAWVEILADLLQTLVLSIDPAEVVLGGGLSQAEGLLPDLQARLEAQQWPGFSAPRLRRATGGATAAALGAAYAAWIEEAQDA